MKQELYIIHHGEKEKSVGDVPLTELGHVQAKITAKYLEEN